MTEQAPYGEGRYKAALIDSEHYLLTCNRYIELNPVRAQNGQASIGVSMVKLSL